MIQHIHSLKLPLKPCKEEEKVFKGEETVHWGCLMLVQEGQNQDPLGTETRMGLRQNR